MEGHISASFSSSLSRLVDKILADRPDRDQIFDFAESFFLNEKTENPKVSQALLSLKFSLKKPQQFTALVAEIFDTLLPKQGPSPLSLTIPVSEAVKVVARLLQRPQSAFESNISGGNAGANPSGIVTSSGLSAAGMGGLGVIGTSNDCYALSIFESVVINDVKSTLEFREFESLLRLGFVLAEMDCWLNSILPFLVHDPITNKVQCSSQYSSRTNLPSLYIRSFEDESALVERLLVLFENDVVSYEEINGKDTNGISIILSELFRGYLKQFQESMDEAYR